MSYRRLQLNSQQQPATSAQQVILLLTHISRLLRAILTRSMMVMPTPPVTKNQGMLGSSGQLGLCSPGAVAFSAPTTVMRMRMGKPRTYRIPTPQTLLCSLSVRKPWHLVLQSKPMLFTHHNHNIYFLIT